MLQYLGDSIEFHEMLIKALGGSTIQIDYDIGKALRPSYGGFIDPKNSNHTVALEEPFPALSKRLSLLGEKKKKRLSLGFVPKRIY